MNLIVKLETVVFTIFYLVLIAVLIVPLLKLLNSPTAFEEFQIENEAELPSITICPFPELNLDKDHLDDEIKDFSHAHLAIEKAKKEYFGNITWTKSYNEW